MSTQEEVLALLLAVACWLLLAPAELAAVA